MKGSPDLGQAVMLIRIDNPVHMSFDLCTDV